MTSLSPQAQAVLDAAEDDCIHPTDLHKIVAAALRAAAENFLMDWDAIQCCDFLLDMADELEAQ